MPFFSIDKIIYDARLCSVVAEMGIGLNNKGKKSGAKREEWEHPVAEKAAEIFGVPKDIAVGAMIVTVTGRTDIYIENYSNIIEYTDNSIKLQGRNTRVKISGSALKADYFTKAGMKVKGRINEIKFY